MSPLHQGSAGKSPALMSKSETHKNKKENVTMRTIHDYLEMVKELKELGEMLVDYQYDECDEPAEWVDEVECMNAHLKCCLRELERAGVKG